MTREKQQRVTQLCQQIASGNLNDEDYWKAIQELNSLLEEETLDRKEES